MILFRVEVDMEFGCDKFGGKCVEDVIQVFSPVSKHQCFLPSIVCDVVANEYVGQSRSPLCPANPFSFRLAFKRWVGLGSDWAVAWLVEIVVGLCNGRCRQCSSRLGESAFWLTTIRSRPLHFPRVSQVSVGPT